MEREAGWGSGWGTNVNPWLIHVNVWQKPLQYCKVISLQLIKINEKKNNEICGNFIGHLAEFTLNLWMALNRMDILKMLIPPIYEHGLLFQLFVSSVFHPCFTVFSV